MVETTLSRRLAAFADAVTTAMRGATAVMQAREEEQQARASRARRSDLDRPRVHVHKGGANLFSRLPQGDPRNLMPAGGRLSQDSWHVWTLQPEAATEGITGSFVGSFDTWGEAMLVAHHVAEYGRVPAQWVANVSDLIEGLLDETTEDVFCGVGEVPC